MIFSCYPELPDLVCSYRVPAPSQRLLHGLSRILESTPSNHPEQIERPVLVQPSASRQIHLDRTWLPLNATPDSTPKLAGKFYWWQVFPPSPRLVVQDRFWTDLAKVSAGMAGQRHRNQEAVQFVRSGQAAVACLGADFLKSYERVAGGGTYKKCILRDESDRTTAASMLHTSSYLPEMFGNQYAPVVAFCKNLAGLGSRTFDRGSSSSSSSSSGSSSSSSSGSSGSSSSHDSGTGVSVDLEFDLDLSVDLAHDLGRQVLAEYVTAVCIQYWVWTRQLFYRNKSGRVSEPRWIMVIPPGQLHRPFANESSHSSKTDSPTWITLWSNARLARIHSTPGLRDQAMFATVRSEALRLPLGYFVFRVLTSMLLPLCDTDDQVDALALEFCDQLRARNIESFWVPRHAVPLSMSTTTGHAVSRAVKQLDAPLAERSIYIRSDFPRHIRATRPANTAWSILLPRIFAHRCFTPIAPVLGRCFSAHDDGASADDDLNHRVSQIDMFGMLAPLLPLQTCDRLIQCLKLSADDLASVSTRVFDHARSILPLSELEHHWAVQPISFPAMHKRETPGKNIQFRTSAVVSALWRLPRRRRPQGQPSGPGPIERDEASPWNLRPIALVRACLRVFASGDAPIEPFVQRLSPRNVEDLIDERFDPTARAAVLHAVQRVFRPVGIGDAEDETKVVLAPSCNRHECYEALRYLLYDEDQILAYMYVLFGRASELQVAGGSEPEGGDHRKQPSPRMAPIQPDEKTAAHVVDQWRQDFDLLVAERTGGAQKHGKQAIRRLARAASPPWPKKLLSIACLTWKKARPNKMSAAQYLERVQRKLKPKLVKRLLQMREPAVSNAQAKVVLAHFVQTPQHRPLSLAMTDREMELVAAFVEFFGEYFVRPVMLVFRHRFPRPLVLKKSPGEEKPLTRKEAKELVSHCFQAMDQPEQEWGALRQGAYPLLAELRSLPLERLEFHNETFRTLELVLTRYMARTGLSAGGGARSSDKEASGV